MSFKTHENSHFLPKNTDLKAGNSGRPILLRMLNSIEIMKMAATGARPGNNTKVCTETTP